MIDQQFVGRTWCQHWPLPRMMEGGVLCLLVALRPRLELRYQPVTLPKLNVVPTTNFFPASQAWASSAHSRSKQLCKCPLVQRCRRDVRACIATMARLKSYPPTSWPGHLSVQFCNGYSAAIARSSTNPSPHPFSWGRASRIRSTGISLVPCHRGATLGSRSPASGASRSFGLAQFFRHSRRPSIQKQASVVCNIQLNWQGTVCVLVDCAIVPVRNIGTGKPKTVSARSPYARAASPG
jgi:hypothetical protein